MENPRQDLLIVDDDNAIRTLIFVAMTRRGLKCDSAKDGQDALEKMTTGTYAVVLLDLMMPRMDGAEFLKRLDEWRLTAARRPVVLLMTAFGNERLPILGESIQAVVKKPFDIDELVALVSGCVEQRKAHESLQREPAAQNDLQRCDS
jgi:DNA-binding response OmpR family regulator